MDFSKISFLKLDFFLLVIAYDFMYYKFCVSVCQILFVIFCLFAFESTSVFHSHSRSFQPFFSCCSCLVVRTVRCSPRSGISVLFFDAFHNSFAPSWLLSLPLKPVCQSATLRQAFARLPRPRVPRSFFFFFFRYSCNPA